MAKDPAPIKLHDHKFIIPIEWEYTTRYSTKRFDAIAIGKGKKVTKLLCECGETKEL